MKQMPLLESLNDGLSPFNISYHYVTRSQKFRRGLVDDGGWTNNQNIMEMTSFYISTKELVLPGALTIFSLTCKSHAPTSTLYGFHPF